MTESEKFVTRAAMERFGGGFMQAMATAWGRADTENAKRLLAAFPEIERDYGAGSVAFKKSDSMFRPQAALSFHKVADALVAASAIGFQRITPTPITLSAEQARAVDDTSSCEASHRETRIAKDGSQ